MKINKRNFVRSAAAALATGSISASISRALAAPALGRTKSIMDVGHIVILIQENRSFDHYFGTLNGVRGYGDRITAPLSEGRTVWEQRDENGNIILPFNLDGTSSNAQHVKSLPHSWPDQHAAWNEGRMDGWIPAKGEMTMAHFTETEIPLHWTLANSFTLCDAYFSSIPGSTNPNRSHLMTGTIDPHGTHGGPMNLQPEVTPTGTIEGGPKFSWSSFPERLEAADVSWRIYQGVDENGPFEITELDEIQWGPADPNARVSAYNILSFFKQYNEAPPGSPLYEKAMTRRTPGQFAEDVKQGRLPQVSWLMPPMLHSEHPRRSPANGAAYIATILDALTANPEVWGKTAFLIVYDENDGYFDHVLPPTPPANSAQGRSNIHVADDIHSDGLPFGLGFRVPAFVISPWSKGGVVCSQVFDHTSVIRFMETRFGVYEPNISPWRREICGDLTSAFDFSFSSPAKPALPETAGYVAFSNQQEKLPPPAPPAIRSMPVQVSGARPSRALPHRLAVQADAASEGMVLTFENTGAIGAVFHVFSGHDAPKRYSVAAHSTLQDMFSAGESDVYDLKIIGPNGFLRSFTSARAYSAPTVDLQASRQILRLALRNWSGDESQFKVTDNAYGAEPMIIALPAGGEKDVIWPAASSYGWYDLTVTTNDAIMRAAGHIETGHISMSDPA